jgi:hypothetical protein
MPLSDAKKKELRDLEAKAAKILKEMEAEDVGPAPKKAKKQMGSKTRRHNIHQRRQMKKLEKENY